MTHSEIQRRNQLIAFIENAKDQNLIDEVLRMLHINFDDSVFITSMEQKQAVYEAQREVAEGKWISEEDADREIDLWLTE